MPSIDPPSTNEINLNSLVDNQLVEMATTSTTTQEANALQPTIFNLSDCLVEETNATRRNKQPFPVELESFSFADRQCLICGNEKDPNSSEMLEVAQKIILSDDDGNEYYSLEIKNLITFNLRKLARQFGLKNLGPRTKFEIRLALAEKKNCTSRYNIDALANNPRSSSDNTKNIIRVINAVFHPDNYETFLCINDRKDRKDFEIKI
jgi:hypothetical protein